MRSLGDIRHTLLGSYTPNSRLYMPSVGETGWGQLVNQNFAILDGVSNVNSIMTTFTSLDTAIVPITVFDQFTMVSDTAIQYAYIYSSAATVPTGFTIKPSSSLRYLIFYIDGNFTMNGTIDTYPVNLSSEPTPNTPAQNTTAILKHGMLCNSLQTLITKSNGNVTMNIQEPYAGAYVDFNTRRIGILGDTAVTIPHAIAAGGATVTNENTNGKPGTSGTATNTCNGGGGSGGTAGNFSNGSVNSGYGGTGCIFGQYPGGANSSDPGKGYGSNVTSLKYRCALVFIVNGNITITGTISQIGGNSPNGSNTGGFGGGGSGSGYYGNGYNLVYGNGGGGGAPVFIYYTGTYTNNGTINTSGGLPSSNAYSQGGNGGAGGIKATKISF